MQNEGLLLFFLRSGFAALYRSVSVLNQGVWLQLQHTMVCQLCGGPVLDRVREFRQHLDSKSENVSSLSATRCNFKCFNIRALQLSKTVRTRHLPQMSLSQDRRKFLFGVVLLPFQFQMNQKFPSHATKKGSRLSSNEASLSTHHCIGT